MLDRFIDLGYVVITRRVAQDQAAAIALQLRAERRWDRLFGPEGVDRNRLTRPVSIDVATLMSDALEAGAHVLVYGWNRLFPDPREEVRVNLGVGDAIIFRGDLIHAGGAYATDNIRLHAYLDVTGVPRHYNTTFLHLIGSESTIRRHLSRDHHVRFSLRHVLPELEPQPHDASSTDSDASDDSNESDGAMSEMDISGHGSPAARLSDVSGASSEDVQIVLVACEAPPARRRNEWFDSESDDDEQPAPTEGISSNREQPVLARPGREITFEDVFGSDDSGSD